jgi:hypothetical protein
MRARQPVVGIEEAAVLAQQFFQHLARFIKAAAQVQGLGLSQARPVHLAAVPQLGINRLRQFRLSGLDMHLGPQAAKVQGEARLRCLALLARFDCCTQVAHVDQLVHRQQGIAAVEGAPDALQHGIGCERLEDVIVGHQFGGADHLAELAFAGDHEEHGGGIDQAVVAQVFQHLLPVLPAFQGVFAQDQVVGPGFQRADRLIGTGGIVNAHQAAQAQHIVQAGAHAGIGLDDQRCQALQFIHGFRRRTRAVLILSRAVRFCENEHGSAAWLPHKGSLSCPGPAQGCAQPRRSGPPRLPDRTGRRHGRGYKS